MIDLVAARCFHFIYIYACNLVSLFFVLLPFLGE